jgi:hypothetical protein
MDVVQGTSTPSIVIAAGLVGLRFVNTMAADLSILTFILHREKSFPYRNNLLTIRDNLYRVNIAIE